MEVSSSLQIRGFNIDWPDIENAKTVLQMAGIIKSTSNPEWAAGETILVQTGDIVDRGTYAWDIYRLMQALRSEAAGAGGRVVSILGNHEVMNAIGDWRYVTHDEIRYNGGTKQRMQDLSNSGWLGREWLAK
jgi:3',5'-cyclic AMP phosphodiesterase CpdA